MNKFSQRLKEKVKREVEKLPTFRIIFYISSIPLNIQSDQLFQSIEYNHLKKVKKVNKIKNLQKKPNRKTLQFVLASLNKGKEYPFSKGLMKFILEYKQKSIEIDLETNGEADVDLSNLLKGRAQQLFPELKNYQIELVTESGFEIMNCSKEKDNDNDNNNNGEMMNETQQVSIQVVEENWQMLKNNSEVNLLNQICKSAQNIQLETYNSDIHKQVRDDLIVSFQPYFSYFVEKLCGHQMKVAQNMNIIFLEIMNSIHTSIEEFNFTGAYIVKLCCDYLTPTFHISLDQLPSNLQKQSLFITIYI